MRSAWSRFWRTRWFIKGPVLVLVAAVGLAGIAFMLGSRTSPEDLACAAVSEHIEHEIRSRIAIDECHAVGPLGGQWLVTGEATTRGGRLLDFTGYATDDFTSWEGEEMLDGQTRHYPADENWSSRLFSVY